MMPSPMESHHLAPANRTELNHTFTYLETHPPARGITEQACAASSGGGRRSGLDQGTAQQRASAVRPGFILPVVYSSTRKHLERMEEAPLSPPQTPSGGHGWPLTDLRPHPSPFPVSGGHGWPLTHHRFPFRTCTGTSSAWRRGTSPTRTTTPRMRPTCCRARWGPFPEAWGVGREAWASGVP
jgi:hypothetical protein